MAWDIKRVATGFQDMFRFVGNQDSKGKSQKDNNDKEEEEEDSSNTSSDKDAKGSVDEVGPNNNKDTMEVRHCHLTPIPDISLTSLLPSLSNTLV